MSTASEGAVRRVRACPTGRLHSRFARAVNLRLGPRLVQVAEAGSAAAGCPFGVDLDAAEWREFLARLDRLDGVDTLLLAVAGAGEPAGSLLTVTGPGRCHRPAAVAPRRTGALEVAGRPGLEAPDLDDRLELAARVLADGGDLAPVQWLLGRGPGLTPSGDDMLVGLLAVLTAHGRLDAGSRAALGALVASRGDELTTDVAVEYLTCALAGEFAAGVLDVLAAPAAGLPRAVSRLAAHGHTSGADTLVGMAAAHHHLESERVVA